MTAAAKQALEVAGMAAAVGVDPTPLLHSDDPVVVGVWLQVVEHATEARTRLNEDQAARFHGVTGG